MPRFNNALDVSYFYCEIADHFGKRLSRCYKAEPNKQFIGATRFIRAPLQ